MQYKTMILELLQANQEVHERLRQERKLLLVVELLAAELKASHEEWTESLRVKMPSIDHAQITSAAMEMALHELKLRLLIRDSSSAHAMSLDQVMAYLKAQTSDA